MGFIYRLLLILVAITMPAACIVGAANLVYRMPDLYVYEFNRYQTTDEVGLGIKDDDLGNFFSDFMLGKKTEFSLTAEYRDRKQSVFSAVEQLNMEHARKQLNHSLFVFAATIAVFGTCCGIYLHRKQKRELRNAFKAGSVVYGLGTVVWLVAFTFPAVKRFLYGMIFVRPFGADDVLPQMLTKEFAQMSIIAIAVVSLVLLILLSSVIWRLTKPRRMFW